MSPARSTQLLVLSGAAAVVFGVFAPAADAGLLGGGSYWSLFPWGGRVVVAAAAVAAWAALRGRVWLLRAAAAALWIAGLYPLLRSLGEDAPADPISGLVRSVEQSAQDLALQFVDLRWGLLLMAAGALLLAWGALRARS